VEEVYKDRDQFANLVRDIAKPDVGKMGIEILSFTIKDVYDNVDYLASLGKSQTAAVKRDAEIGVAQANRDAGIREAECEKAAMDIKYSTDTKIEDNSRAFKLQKANFDKEVNSAKAEAQLAYELQAAKIQQRIRNEEIQIQVVERRKQIEIEDQEIKRKEKELIGTVKLPAEAEAYKVQTVAEGTLTVEEVYKDRDQFANLVRDIAKPDVGKMGIEILSFTIKDVYDNVDYLASLGKSQTAAVKRDAEIGVAQANRDAGIREAECEKAAMDIKYSTDTKIEDNSRAFKLQKANFDKEVNSAKAEAQLAYELQAAKIQQRIRNEEIQIQVVERRKQIEIEDQEIKRKEKELIGTVKLPAEAEAYKVQTVAEGNRTRVVESAKAEGEKIRLTGAAEARAVEAVGRAEAESMRMKASAYKQYGDAAVMSLVLEALPSIAAEVAAPLARTDEIVLIGGSNNTTNEINKLVGTLPPAVQALTGVDITGALGKIPGATMVK